MCKKIFVAGTAQHCGKTTTSISLMHLASRYYDRVGFMKPIGPKVEQYQGRTVDRDAALMAKLFALDDDLDLMSPVAFHKNFTRDYLTGVIDPQSLRSKILHSCAELEGKNDLLIIEGAGHGGVGSVVGLNNAQVARMLDAPMIMVSEGGIGSVIDAVFLNLALIRQEQADLRLILVNKLISRKRQMALEHLQSAFSNTGIALAGGLNYSPVLANPTVGRIADLFQLPLHGDQSARSRIVYHMHLGAAASQKVIDGLLGSTLLILTSSRDELIVTLSSLYHIPAYQQKIAGLVIAGYTPVSKVSQQILDDSNIPYIRVQQTTAEIFGTVKEYVAKISGEDQEKIAWIKKNAETFLDFEQIDQLLSAQG